MSDYSKVKGRGRDIEIKNTNAPKSQPLPPLSPERRATIALRRDMIYHLMPEFVAMFDEFQKEGLVDGWRSIVKVKNLDTGEEV